MSDFFIAKTFQGLEQVLADELKLLGAHQIQLLKRAVSFEGDPVLMYRSNMFLRSAIRILVGVRNFRAATEEDLYQQMKRIPWEDYLQADQFFAIDAVTGSHLFKNSHYVALKTKDALVDRFRQKRGRRPSVDLKRPDVRIHVNIRGDEVSTYLDSSGDSLHLRGYRKVNTKAPINEVLAAGMILLSGWKGEEAFFDPMCGSGTLPIEAGLMASQTAPGLLRKGFGFQQWSDFDPKAWERVIEEARELKTEARAPIFAADISPVSIKAANENIRAAGLESHIQPLKQSFLKAEAPADSGYLLMNPPYDERLVHADIKGFYKEIGDCFKPKYKGWKAWLISSNMEAMKHVGLKPMKRIQLFNGPLPCKFQGYEMY